MGRMERINEFVKREISQLIIREMGDPRVQFVSITNVDVSPDMQHAKVFFSVLGDQKQAKDAQAGLDGACGMLRALLGKAMKTRHTPELRFIYDNSLEYSVNFERKIKEIVDGSHNDSENHKET